MHFIQNSEPSKSSHSISISPWIVIIRIFSRVIINVLRFYAFLWHPAANRTVIIRVSKNRPLPIEQSCFCFCSAVLFRRYLLSTSSLFCHFGARQHCLVLLVSMIWCQAPAGTQPFVSPPGPALISVSFSSLNKNSRGARCVGSPEKERIDKVTNSKQVFPPFIIALFVFGGEGLSNKYLYEEEHWNFICTYYSKPRLIAWLIEIVHGGASP